MSFERFEYDVAQERGEARASNTGRSASGIGLSHKEIHDAIDRMAEQRRPEHYSERNWHRLLKDLRTVGEQWLDIALACGWTPLHLFGCPPAGSRRIDHAGVALLLRGRPIESIDTSRIVITNRAGPPNVFYRQPPGCSVPLDMGGAVLIWSVQLKDLP